MLEEFELQRTEEEKVSMPDNVIAYGDFQSLVEPDGLKQVVICPAHPNEFLPFCWEATGTSSPLTHFCLFLITCSHTVAAGNPPLCYCCARSQEF